MKFFLIFVALSVSTVFLSGCGHSSRNDSHDHDTTESINESQALYEKVMRLHDEGMERMDEIQTLKRELKEKIESAPDLVESKSNDIEQKILRLDSASKGMMVWMRQFHPENDTLDEAEYRDYLESQLEQVKKVKNDIFDAIARAKEE